MLQQRMDLVDEVLVAEDDSAKASPLAVDMLGGRIDDDVRSERQRLLQERRREDIVDDQLRAVLMGKIGEFDNVLKIRPPLPFSQANADLLIGLLDETLSELVTSQKA